MGGRHRPAWAMACAAMLALGACTLRPSLEGYAVLPVLGERPAGLQVRFLGTSGFLLSDGHHSIVIDGFVSRPRAEAVLFGRVRPEADAVERHILRHVRGDLAALFVAHTHFDHALDVPVLAADPSLAIYGPDDLAALLPAGRPFHPLQSRTPVRIGRFIVTPFETLHSPRDLAPGRMTAPLLTPARARAYKTGVNHAFLIDHPDCRMLIVTSAGEIGRTFVGVDADVVFLSLGRLGLQGPQRIGRYWNDTVVASGARLVVPVHWDDPTLPLEEPLAATPYLLDRIDLALQEVRRATVGTVAVRLPTADGALDLGLAAPGCAG